MATISRKIKKQQRIGNQELYGEHDPKVLAMNINPFFIIYENIS